VTRKKDVATLTIEPFDSLPKKTRADLAAEAERLASFVEHDARHADVRFA
jgi:hypothetical protein